VVKSTTTSSSIQPFDRKFYDRDIRIRSIGSGSIGGKAQGLALLNDLLSLDFERSEFPQIQINIPSLIVIRTGVFDAFMKRNSLYEVAFSNASDDRITNAFLRADLPFEVLGDLRTIIEQVNTPLAIRSSSLLEDATFEPFAGIYATKMIPNDQYDPRGRFNNLIDAIKFIYASTFYKRAKNYRMATNHPPGEEKMAVIIQEVVGKRHYDRFYPELSGVARSYNFYPVGKAKHEDGVINLALGLGKTIVDGGISWAYSPAYPKVGPPYKSLNALIKQSQREFWTIAMGSPPALAPRPEMEHLIQEDLSVAEKHNTLRYLSSTYDAQSDRIVPGINSNGPRVLNFASLLVLKSIPVNDLVHSFLQLCEEKLNNPVEIEFAMTFNPNRMGFLQVRPMVVSSDEVELNHGDLIQDNVLLASEHVLGNGHINDIKDIVYVNPDHFDLGKSRQIARELERVNQILLSDDRPYLLIVFGRLGSSDPWLGIPANWGQISGVKTIVEATQEGINIEMSQGSHFFHNLTSLGISYFSVPISGQYNIDWPWLKAQEEIQYTQFVRHIRVENPLQIKIDGRTGRGVILKNGIFV